LQYTKAEIVKAYATWTSKGAVQDPSAGAVWTAVYQEYQRVGLSSSICPTDWQDIKHAEISDDTTSDDVSDEETDDEVETEQDEESTTEATTTPEDSAETTDTQTGTTTTTPTDSDTSSAN